MGPKKMFLLKFLDSKNLGYKRIWNQKIKKNCQNVPRTNNAWTNKCPQNIGSKKSLGARTYGWFHPATAKICWYSWKLQYCNPCDFLSSNKIFMKIGVLFICVCKHSDIKLGNLRDFWTIFNMFAKLIFALKFKNWVLTRPN